MENGVWWIGAPTIGFLAFFWNIVLVDSKISRRALAFFSSLSSLVLGVIVGQSRDDLVDPLLGGVFVGLVAMVVLDKREHEKKKEKERQRVLEFKEAELEAARRKLLDENLRRQ